MAAGPKHLHAPANAAMHASSRLQQHQKALTAVCLVSDPHKRKPTCHFSLSCLQGPEPHSRPKSPVTPMLEACQQAGTLYAAVDQTDADKPSKIRPQDTKAAAQR
jgi:hypothetical protein